MIYKYGWHRLFFNPCFYLPISLTSALSVFSSQPRTLKDWGTFISHFPLTVAFLGFPNCTLPNSPPASEIAFSSLLQKYFFPFLPPKSWLPVSTLSFLLTKHLISCKLLHSHCHNQNQHTQGSRICVCSRTALLHPWQPPGDGHLNTPRASQIQHAQTSQLVFSFYFLSQSIDPSSQPPWNSSTNTHFQKDETRTQSHSTCSWCLCRAASLSHTVFFQLPSSTHWWILLKFLRGEGVWRLDNKIWVHSCGKSFAFWNVCVRETHNYTRDGGMASLTQWIWVWANSGRWWRTGKPGMLQAMGS